MQFYCFYAASLLFEHPLRRVLELFCLLRSVCGAASEPRSSIFPVPARETCNAAGCIFSGSLDKIDRWKAVLRPVISGAWHSA